MSFPSSESFHSGTAGRCAAICSLVKAGVSPSHAVHFLAVNSAADTLIGVSLKNRALPFYLPCEGEPMTRTLPTLAILLALALPAHAQKLTVTGGKADQTNAVVVAPLAAGANAANSVTLPDGLHAAAQRTADGKYLVFVLPKLKAGETIQVTPTALNYVKAPPRFQFGEEKDGITELTFDGRKVLQYFQPKHDASNHYYTFKPFHNVYDPAKGETMLTNSSAKTDKDGLYPHHRGLFFGFNKITYDGKAADIWHGTDKVFSEHDKSLATEVGEVYGRERSAISWYGKDG